MKLVALFASFVSLAWVAAQRPADDLDTTYAQEVTVTRLEQNPLITVETSASLGANVNGPTVIRVPDWVNRPLGRYRMYFANHIAGEFIRMAYADSIAGPWTIYEPGVIHARDTAFFRPPPQGLGGFATHIASPEIFVDTTRKRLVMWFHGWWTGNGPAGKQVACLLHGDRRRPRARMGVDDRLNLGLGVLEGRAAGQRAGARNGIRMRGPTNRSVQRGKCPWQGQADPRSLRV